MRSDRFCIPGLLRIMKCFESLSAMPEGLEATDFLFIEWA